MISPPTSAPKEFSPSKPTTPTQQNGRDYANTPVVTEKSNEEYEGVVKRYSERNGLGFISNEELEEEYGKAVRVFREEFEPKGLKVGDEVAFRIVLDGRAGCPN